MKDGKPFGIGGLWENWKEPASGEGLRSFGIIITTEANDLVAEIHDRMNGIGKLRCSPNAESLVGCSMSDAHLLTHAPRAPTLTCH